MNSWKIVARPALAAALLLASLQAFAQDQFLGEMRWVGFNFAPRDWALCNGQLLPIAQYTALFSLLGTQYGGNGQTTFALPDMRGRMPLHYGQGPGLSNRDIGEMGGSEFVTLTENELPIHSHTAYGLKQLAARGYPAGNYPARISTDTGSGVVVNDIRAYRKTGTPVAMAGGMIGPAGGGQPHANMPPYLTLTCIIAINGIYPSRP